MVDTAESLCPNVMMKPNLRQELIRASAKKMAIPKGFVRATLLEQSAVDIINKIRWGFDQWYAVTLKGNLRGCISIH